MGDDLQDLLAAAKNGRGALIRFLYERSDTERDADDFIRLIERLIAAEAKANG